MATNVVEDGELITAYNGTMVFRLQGSDCIGCGQCVPECPTEALLEDPWSIEVGGHVYESSYLAFDSIKCIVGQCNQPCEAVCPVLAITVGELEGGSGGGQTHCDLFPEECQDLVNGTNFNNWLNNQCNVLTPKNAHSLLQSEAAQWSMTAEGYIADKLSLIAESGSYKTLGKIARNAGWAGVAYGSYSAVVAVSDGNLTANELLGMVSTTLGIIAIIPGVGTAVGLSGLALISAGSLVLGLMSNTELGKATTIANWDTRNTCN